MLKHRSIEEAKRKKIFNGCRTFLDIENRLKNIENEKDRGLFFEIFAEASMICGIFGNVKIVYPEKSIPTKVLKKLKIKNRSGDLRGIDGVFENQSGEIHTYQVKFKGKRDLAWSPIAKSISKSTYADALMVFTNAPFIDEDVYDTKVPVYSVRREQLLDLDKDQISNIISVISTGKLKPKKKKESFNYQNEARTSVLKSLEKDPRTQLIMACGTGKTLVGQRIIEGYKEGQLFLVLVPSLHLLRQTFKDYLDDTKWSQFPAICVGSDKKATDAAGYDALNLKPLDMDFKTSTDSKDVKAFIDRKFKKAVIFSTYNSCHIVSKALGKRSIDLAICDEAHRTAADKKGLFSYCLNDKNIKINKRLFMTATPRMYTAPKNVTDYKIQKKYSMDDDDVYGKVAYEYTFKQGTDFGIIVPYKIIISIITNEDLSKKDIGRSKTMVDGAALNTKFVASQISLKKAIEKYDVSKVISFHRRIIDAERFTDDSPASIKQYISIFETYNVSSNQTPTERSDYLRDFKLDEKALVANANCLTEGVNIPAVDMVAFMAPRRSKIGIVQAAGRAMRKPRDKPKDLGYIFVPCYLEINTGETIDEAVKKADFGDLYDILMALIHSDKVLKDELTLLKIDAGYTGARANGMSRSDDFKSNIDNMLEVIGEGLNLRQIKESVSAMIIDRTIPSWYDHYGKLKAFYLKYGHCRVIESEDKILSRWIWKNRTRNRKNLLSQERINLLNEIKFIWDINEDYWFENYEKLKIIYDETGVASISQSSSDKKLFSWIQGQRNKKKSGMISDKQVRLLNKIDFVWDYWDKQFEIEFGLCENYFLREGNLFLNKGSDESDVFNAIVVLRRKWNIGSLNKQQKLKLKNIGFIEDQKNVALILKLKKLEEYKSTYGDMSLQKDRDLNLYFRNLLKGKSKNSKERVLAVLREYGFSYENILKEMDYVSNQDQWEKSFNNYKYYINKTIKRKDIKSVNAYKWFNSNRNKYLNGKLNKEKMRLMESLKRPLKKNEKINIYILNDFTKSILSQLERFKNERGHSYIFRQDNEIVFKVVMRWMIKYKDGKLDSEIKKCLDDMDFDFSRSKLKFKRKCYEVSELLKETSMEKLFNVKDSKDKDIIWIKDQQNKLNKGLLNDEQISLLSKIGIDSSNKISNYKKVKTFEQNIELLKNYYSTYGTYVVVRKKNPKLHNFVRRIKSEARGKGKGKLSKDQRKVLRELGIIND